MLICLYLLYTSRRSRIDWKDVSIRAEILEENDRNRQYRESVKKSRKSGHRNRWTTSEDGNFDPRSDSKLNRIRRRRERRARRGRRRGRRMMSTNAFGIEPEAAENAALDSDIIPETTSPDSGVGEYKTEDTKSATVSMSNSDNPEDLDILVITLSPTEQLEFESWKYL